MKVEAEMILKLTQDEAEWLMEILLTAYASEELGKQADSFAERLAEEMGYEFAEGEDVDEEETHVVH